MSTTPTGQVPRISRAGGKTFADTGARKYFEAAIKYEASDLLLRADLTKEQTVVALVDLASDFRQGGFLQRAIASYDEALSHDPKQRAALSLQERRQAVSRLPESPHAALSARQP